MEIVIFFIGIVFSAVGGFILHDHAQFKKSARESKGRVVGFKTSRGSKGATHYTPVVGYVWEGVEHQFTGRMGSNRVTLSIGDEVDILVSGTDPTKARLKGGGIAVFGSVFLALGLACVIGFFFLFEINLFSLGIAAVITCTVIYQLLSRLRRHHIYSVADLKQAAGKIRNGALEDAAINRRGVANQGETAAVEERDNIITDPEELAREQQKGKAPVWLGVLFFLVGVGMLAGGGVMTHSRSEFLDTALTAKGKVVSFERSTSTSDGTTTTVYYPRVEYTPPGGETVVFRHDQGSSHPSLRRGDQVKVLYSPSDHKDAIIDEGWMNWLGPVVLLAIGSIFSLVGFSVARKRLKSEQPPSRDEIRLDI